LRARSERFDENLGNRIYDPQWMLCRQWQTGEFAGSDNGSPAEARVKWQHYPLQELSVDGNTPVAYTGQQPLEAEVERVAVQAGVPLRIEMGRQLQRMLRRELDRGAEMIITGLRQHDDLKFTLDADTSIEDRQENATKLSNRSLQSWMHAAVQTGALDGGKLYDALRSGKKLSEFTDGTNAKADAVGNDWVAWFDQQYNQPVDETKDAWRPERMEYRFQAHLEAKEQAAMQLGAEEYYEGRLEWFSFQVQSSSLDSQESSTTPKISHRIPAEVAYPGMPAARWWEMEDSKINLLALEASATQSGRLALMEFGLMYSNDWFLLPLRVPVGGLLDIEELKIRNVFGEWTTARHYQKAPNSEAWSYFRLSGALQPSNQDDQYLFLPPTVVDLKESPNVEEVYLARDEMANMVWGIEHFVPDGIDGRREGNVAALDVATYLQRLSEEVSGSSPATAAENDAKVQYKLATEVPEYWIPFKAVQVPNGGGAVRLQRAAMPRVYEGLRIERIRPQTSLLRPGLDGPSYQPFFIPEEEVPKAGIRVSRSWQRARWYNGRVSLWSGFHKRNGRGQGNSGLQFDSLREK
jgi:hypothetical protein